MGQGEKVYVGGTFHGQIFHGGMEFFINGTKNLKRTKIITYMRWFTPSSVPHSFRLCFSLVISKELFILIKPFVIQGSFLKIWNKNLNFSVKSEVLTRGRNFLIYAMISARFKF